MCFQVAESNYGARQDEGHARLQENPAVPRPEAAHAQACDGEESYRQGGGGEGAVLAPSYLGLEHQLFFFLYS